MAKRRKNSFISDIFGKQETYHGKIIRTPYTGRGYKYKGVMIRELNEGGFVTSLERESIFETFGDAKRFVDSYMNKRKNPSHFNYTLKIFDEDSGRGSEQIFDRRSSILAAIKAIKQSGYSVDGPRVMGKYYSITIREKNMNKRKNPTKTKNYYEVIVGNIGTVYSGPNGFTANHTYSSYVKSSKSSVGRASGEDVTLIKNGDIQKEYFGKRENPGKEKKLPLGKWVKAKMVKVTRNAVYVK